MNVLGKYTLRVLKGNRIIRTIKCENIVTNIGRANIFNGNFGTKVAIGTGRAPENLSTTALGNKYGTEITGEWKAKYASSIDVPNNIIKSSGVLVGRTATLTENIIVTELGIVNNDGELTTYSLLRDIAGELTTITVNVGEVLEIEYEIVIQCTYSQEFTADSGLKRVVTYRMPAINNISNTASTSSTNLLKSAEDGLSTGTPPTDVHTGNAGTTSKNNKTFTVNVPANVTSYGGDVFGFLISNMMGFTIGIFTSEKFKIESVKEYTAKAVFDL